jgi:hypothetical protein
VSRFTHKKVILIVVALLLLVAAIFAAYVSFSPPHAQTVNVKSPFISLDKPLSNQELLETSLTRLMSIEALSYNVEAKDVFTANATIDLRKNNAEFASTATYDMMGGSATTEVVAKGDDFYFRYTKVPSSDKSSNPEVKYLNKWILKNKETSKGIGAGSEYLGFFMTAANSMDAPFVIGNVTGVTRELTTAAIKSGLYKIVSSTHTNYYGQEAIQYSLKIDYKQVGKLFKDIYLAKDTTSVYIAPSYVMTAPGWGQSNEYDPSHDTLTVWISPSNAQLLGIDRFIDTGMPAFSSKRVVYSKLDFDNISMPSAPEQSIPFNQYYPKD